MEIAPGRELDALIAEKVMGYTMNKSETKREKNMVRVGTTEKGDAGTQPLRPFACL